MIDFSKWQFYKDPVKNENIGVVFTENGITQSRSLKDPDYLAWESQGNTPLPAENT